MTVRVLVISLLVIGIILLFPLGIAAANPSNSDIIAILGEGIRGLVLLLKLAYCAAGVTGLC